MDSGPDTFATLHADIVVQSCAFSTCHGSGTGGLELGGTAEEDLARLVAVPSSVGTLLVDPGDSSNSYLVMKLAGLESIEGDPMPLGTKGLPDPELDRIRSWVDAGAVP